MPRGRKKKVTPAPAPAVEKTPVTEENTPVEDAAPAPAAEEAAPAPAVEDAVTKEESSTKERKPRRPRRTKAQVIDAKIEALEQKKADYQAKIDKIDKDIEDLKAEKTKKKVTLRDVKALLNETGMTEEDLIDMIRQGKIGEKQKDLISQSRTNA